MTAQPKDGEFSCRGVSATQNTTACSGQLNGPVARLTESRKFFGWQLLGPSVFQRFSSQAKGVDNSSLAPQQDPPARLQMHTAFPCHDPPGLPTQPGGLQVQPLYCGAVEEVCSAI